MSKKLVSAERNGDLSTGRAKGKSSAKRRATAGSLIITTVSGASAAFLAFGPAIAAAPSGIALAIGAVGVGSTLFAAKIGKTDAAEGPVSTIPALKASELRVSQDVSEKIVKLHELAGFYEQRQSPLLSSLNGVLANLQQLFSRMSNGTDEQSARLAEVKYADILAKLNQALGKEYYLDIEAHPELWSNPEARMEAVETALNATSEQILRNIRQLNSSRDLIYQVSLDSLMSSNTDEANRKELGIG